MQVRGGEQVAFSVCVNVSLTFQAFTSPCETKPAVGLVWVAHHQALGFDPLPRFRESAGNGSSVRSGGRVARIVRIPQRYFELQQCEIVYSRTNLMHQGNQDQT